MPITEAQRHHLLTQLEATIGKEAAMTLADHLPPVGWADVATKRDLDHLSAELRAEIHLQVSRLDTKFTGKFGEVEGRFGQLERKIGGLEGKIGGLEGKIGGLEGKIGALEGKIGTLDASLTHRMNRSVLTSTIATVGLVLGGMQLVG